MPYRRGRHDAFRNTSASGPVKPICSTTTASVAEFRIDLNELHQDTTTVTFHGEYAGQDDTDNPNRPPLITLGYNKDHRPDLKQLLFSITISDDGAVPLHAKIYDGNTSDTDVHKDTWLFLCALRGNADFLYVADGKLCTRENMGFVGGKNGRFLTVMPATRSEDQWFRNWVAENHVAWVEVHREPNPRNRKAADVVYEGYESPEKSSEGYRVLWYRSSQKLAQDRRQRMQKLERVRTALAELQSATRRPFASAAQARAAVDRVLKEEKVEGWYGVEILEEVQVERHQIGPGRPSANTSYREEKIKSYRIRCVEDVEAIRREACADGLFPLMSNDKVLSVAEALKKYKYQPYVEKRHAQLKSGFEVMPMWLKSPRRVESILWLYYVVELVQALLERAVRQRMAEEGYEGIRLYPEGRESESPTTPLVLGVLAGHRRHRILDGECRELRRFHDPVSKAAEQILSWMGVDLAAYGIE
jgi:transposase